MAKKIEYVSIITKRELWENERKRLLNVPRDKGFKKWLGNRTYPLDWMKKQYGETLTEKTEMIKPSGELFELNCNICGKDTKENEKIINLSFSFCEEYGCEMNICKSCLIKLNKLLSPQNESSSEK